MVARAVRLWGWTENAAEQKRDLKELSALAKAGKPLYGSTDLPEYVQGVAHRNSLWSQLKFGVLPWCVGRFARLGSGGADDPLARAGSTSSSAYAGVIGVGTRELTMGSSCSHNHHGVDTTKYNSSEE